MYFLIIVKVAIKSLFANKLRSFLAVLGIIIGVGAVVAMLALGAGASKDILGRLQSMGTDLLMIRPGQRGTGGVMSGTQQNLKVADAAAIIQEVPEVLAVSPVVQGRAQVKYYENNSQVNVMGAAPTYLSVRNFPIETGRCFTDDECDSLARVAVIGPTTAEELMGRDNPIGATIKVKGINFKVVGVTKSKGDQGWFNPDDYVMTPYTTAMQILFGLDYLNEIDVQGKAGADLTHLEFQITQLLRRRHRIEEDADNDFSVANQAEMLETLSSVSQTMTILLGGVGSISLIVGGIGIMNIMLVTVTERTREIGIRKAIGAKDRDILRQFLFESVLMSILGGLIGVGLGVAVATAISNLTTFNTAVQPQSIALAMSFAAAVGIFFGFYPARRAALLNPIDALRYE